MEPVQQPMDDRRQNDTHRNEEHETSVEGVKTGEELAPSGLRRFNRPHTAKQHRGIQKGIPPSQAFEVGVACHADEQRAKHQRGRTEEVEQQPPEEVLPRQGAMLSGFVPGSSGALVRTAA